MEVKVGMKVEVGEGVQVQVQVEVEVEVEVEVVRTKGRAHRCLPVLELVRVANDVLQLFL